MEDCSRAGDGGLEVWLAATPLADHEPDRPAEEELDLAVAAPGEGHGKKQRQVGGWGAPRARLVGWDGHVGLGLGL
jgi:hypothetical protein